MQIRLAKNSDINTLAQYDKESSLTYWSKSDYLSSLDNHRIIIFENENKLIVATIVVSLIDDEAEILQFWVKHSHKKLGYGKILLNHIITTFTLTHNIKRIFLEVRENNDVAIKLYEKTGFTVVGKRKNFYVVDNWRFDALIMLYQK